MGESRTHALRDDALEVSSASMNIRYRYGALTDVETAEGLVLIWLGTATGYGLGLHRPGAGRSEMPDSIVIANYGFAGFAQTVTSGLFVSLRPRHVAEFSVGKVVGFLAAPHHAVTAISSAAHLAKQL
jgi:hypothetical protein